MSEMRVSVGSVKRYSSVPKVALFAVKYKDPPNEVRLAGEEDPAFGLMSVIRVTVKPLVRNNSTPEVASVAEKYRNPPWTKKFPGEECPAPATISSAAMST